MTIYSCTYVSNTLCHIAIGVGRREKKKEARRDVLRPGLLEAQIEDLFK